MAPDIAHNSPVAEQLTSLVQGKLSENGWITGGPDDSALGEYIILMLVNGKTQDQIATELSTDLLSLSPEDTGAIDFTRWLFQQAENLSNPSKNNGQRPQHVPATNNTAGPRTDTHQIPASTTNQSLSQMDVAPSDSMEDVQNGSVPRGPKSMRNSPRPGYGPRGPMGQISKAMDRSNDAGLHRVQSQSGSGRINTHNKPGSRGSRQDGNRNFRNNNGRGGGFTGQNTGGGANGSSAGMMQMSPQQQMQMMAMLEQQAQMMASLLPPGQQQAILQDVGLGNFGAQSNGNQPAGGSLFDRVENNPRRQQRGHQARHKSQFQHPRTKDGSDPRPTEGGDVSMDTDEGQSKTTTDSAICKYNLRCTNKDCAFAHQSPAAPIGTQVDVSDVCPYAAACKNKKCVGSHPSPYQRQAHAAEQDCKYFPFCTNSSCPFRHPPMPICKFGADCKRDGCQYTHVTIACKYNPCLNPECPYKHVEGQKRGKYGDKVWTADQTKEHVSDRKFVDDEMGMEELIKPEAVKPTEDEQHIVT